MLFEKGYRLFTRDEKDGGRILHLRRSSIDDQRDLDDRAATSNRDRIGKAYSNRFNPASGRQVKQYPRSNGAPILIRVRPERRVLGY